MSQIAAPASSVAPVTPIPAVAKPVLTYQPRKFGRVSFRSFFAYASVEPHQEKIYSVIANGDHIQVQSGCFNLVLGKDIKRSVRLSAWVALEISRMGEN